MSDTSSPFGFELVRRGYDRGQVDDRITKLVADRDSALARITSLEKRIEELHLETQNAQAQVNDAEPSYAGLGARVEKILRLAEEEAKDLREEARRAAEQHRELAEGAAQQVRNDAEAFAAERKAKAEDEGARIVEKAKGEAAALRSGGGEGRAVQARGGRLPLRGHPRQGRPGRRRLRDQPRQAPRAVRARPRLPSGQGGEAARRDRAPRRAAAAGGREAAHGRRAPRPSDGRDRAAPGRGHRGRRERQGRPRPQRVRARAGRPHQPPRQHQRPADQRPRDAGHAHRCRCRRGRQRRRGGGRPRTRAPHAASPPSSPADAAHPQAATRARHFTCRARPRSGPVRRLVRRARRGARPLHRTGTWLSVLLRPPRRSRP